MSEPTVEPTPEPADPAAQPEPQDTTDWKAEARKWEQRAKEHSRTVKEFELQKQASMTEAEKAVAAARDEGRTSALTEYGQRLARSEFKAAAARRNPAWDADGVLEDLNLTRYVGEDGEPDAKAIAKAVERLVPEPAAPAAGLDLGVKQGAPGAPSMNALIRQAAGRA